MLIDRFMPRWDVVQRHSVVVAATAGVTFEALRGLDLARSRPIRWLFRLRGLPTGALSIEGLCRMGFMPLGEDPGRELLLGLVGRFWTVNGGLLRVAPAAFADFNQRGFAKAVWGFGFEPVVSGRTRVSTETRVVCYGRSTRLWFHAYWLVVRPFSAWIRREVLRLLARQVTAATIQA